MKYKAPNRCPVCDHEMAISSLSCSHCQTKIEGSFTSCKFCRLQSEQQRFIEVFIKCRGSIKEAEKELNISYPTVRSRLNEVIQSLEDNVQNNDNRKKSKRKQEIIQKLEKGQISARRAVKQLKDLKNKT